MNQDPPPAVPSIQPTKGFGDMLLDVFFDPRKAFNELSARPYCLLPLALAMVLGIGFTAVWLSKVEPREFVKTQIENSPRVDQIPAEMRTEMVDQQARFMKVSAWAGVLLGVPTLYLVCAGYFLLVFRFGYGADGLRFDQSFSVTAMSFLAVSLVQTTADARDSRRQGRLECQSPRGVQCESWSALRQE
ncbi:MAG: YIP1 family protein [Vicinamibacteria bacterium]|nr:YIP1 family protein [Vicinamibacteria bacterium]